MRMLVSLAAALALAAPGSAAAQEGSRQIIQINPQNLVLLQIIDPVMGHGVATYFYRQPRTIGGRQGVHFQTRYMIADCDARTIRFGPDTYFNGEGEEIGEGSGISAAARVHSGSLEADLLDVECLNKAGQASIPAWVENQQILADYLDMMQGR